MTLFVTSLAAAGDEVFRERWFERMWGGRTGGLCRGPVGGVETGDGATVERRGRRRRGGLQALWLNTSRWYRRCSLSCMTWELNRTVRKNGVLSCWQLSLPRKQLCTRPHGHRVCAGPDSGGSGQPPFTRGASLTPPVPDISPQRLTSRLPVSEALSLLREAE